MQQNTTGRRTGLILGRMVGVLAFCGVLGMLPGMLRAGAEEALPHFETLQFETVASEPLFHSQTESEMDLSMVLGPAQSDLAGLSL